MTETAKATDDADDFDKAFEGFAGGDKPAAAVDEEVDTSTAEGDDDEALAEEEEAGRQPAASAEEDPLKDLPEGVKRRITEAEARAAAAEHAARSNAGRVSALQKKVDELEKSPRTTKTGVTEDDDPGAETDTDESSFGEEFSEVAAFVERTVEKKVTPIKQKLEEKEAEERETQERNRIRTAFQKLAEAHPDFDQIRVNPEYHQWLEAQPPGIRNMSASEDPADAIALCDLYKEKKGVKRTTSSREQLLAAAEEIPSKGGNRKTGVPDDFDAAFAHYTQSNRKR